MAAAAGRLDDVDGMLAGMTREQMDELEAFDRLEGIGPRRLHRILAVGFSALCNVMRWGGEPFKPDDFLPQWKPQAERPAGGSASCVSPDQAAAMFLMHMGPSRAR